MLGGNATVIAHRLRGGGLHRPAAAGDGAAPAPDFYQQAAGGGVATLLASRPRASPLDVDPSLVVTANIIMLLAGIGFMGALQDALSGFYVTAGARLTEALLATAGIIAGVSGGLTVADVAGVEIDRLSLGTTGWESVTMMAVGAAICAAALRVRVVRPEPDHRCRSRSSPRSPC